MMPDNVLIQPQQSTPGATSSRGAKRTIPPDLLREASQRLSVMALLGGAMWLVADTLWQATWLAFHPGTRWPGLGGPDAIVAVVILASIGLHFYIRRNTRPPEFFLRLGLVYMVVTCFAISLVMHMGLPMSVPLMPQITWIGVVLLLFAAVLPTEPRTMLIVAIIGAAMSPLAMMLTRTHGMAMPRAFTIGLLMHYPDFLLAGVAAVVSWVVMRLGRQVSRAREMGSYQLGELIKRGGMGEVYRATHRMLARPAAIKLIRSKMLRSADGDSSELTVKRFHREAEAAANLRSPHTVELFDFGITEDQTLYFVMELLDGMDLETLVREHGPLPARRVIHILRQATESLEEAHTLGLVHRDIKPANIHLGKVGTRFDFVKVLDFGLVKSVGRENMEQSLATAVGRTPGTPAYMAPEMALGETVDGRADIYALGCVAYFLLTGRLVFEAENTFQMVAKHMRNQPVPPSVRASAEVPAALEKLVLQCLAKKPEERPANAGVVREMLESIAVKSWSDADAREWWTMKAQPLASATVPMFGGSVRAGALAVT